MKVSKLDKRLIDLLAKRGYQSEEELDNFLNPKISLMHNPLDLNGMAEAKERIERAISNKEKVVVYGDYDCDGISACVILYKYFQSCGLTADIYIPDRFDDGYGLSKNMIEQVIEKSNPSLIITVDLGVTAVSEVELIKNVGIDIIVTDHHEPGEQLPNCIVIDPKIAGQKYPFNGLCGAGVALKVVEALSGREGISQYLDICALATIGDIVPLTDENRFIAKEGIEKINRGECLKSYKYMLNKLGIKKLSGADVTFKLVPRINASGRMSQGKKVFDFLISEKDKDLKKLYDDIMADNELRLQSINEGVAILENEASKINFQTDNIILLRGEFHQGVLGILASRICHDYNRPAIIFTKTEEGTLKGSGRSLDSIDLHAALEQCSDLLVRFGGHKMAVGVEIEEDKFEEFKKRLSKNISRQASFKAFLTSETYDIEITEKDISEQFISMLNSLEPFGCKNERPILMMQADSLKVMQMKDASFRHFKLTTKGGKSIVAFAGDKNVDALASPIKKHLIIELENNEFKGKIYPQAVLKNVYIKQPFLKEDKERETMVSLINKFYSCQEESNLKPDKINYFLPYELEKILLTLGSMSYGTLVVVDSKKEADRVSKILSKLKKSFTLSHTLMKNRQNTILISSRGVLTKDEVMGYNTIVFTRQMFSKEKDYFGQVAKVYSVKNEKTELRLDKSREASVYAYTLIKKYVPLIKANNIFEWLNKVAAQEGGVNKIQLLFCLLSFVELGFVRLNLNDFMIEVVSSPPKRELSSSKFMNKMAQ